MAGIQPAGKFHSSGGKPKAGGIKSRAQLAEALKRLRKRNLSLQQMDNYISAAGQNSPEFKELAESHSLRRDRRNARKLLEPPKVKRKSAFASWLQRFRRKQSRPEEMTADQLKASMLLEKLRKDPHYYNQEIERALERRIQGKGPMR